MAQNSGRFHFDGGAATYFGTQILGVLVTVLTVGICFPWALVMLEQWKAKHSYIDGRRLTFTGTAMGLFGNWIKWLLLMFVTLGIYSFWVMPRVTKWKWEHTDFDPRWLPRSLYEQQGNAAVGAPPHATSPYGAPQGSSPQVPAAATAPQVTQSY